MAAGVISDYEDQPLLIGSHHGNYAIATVGRIFNHEALAKQVLAGHQTHFAEMRGNKVNPTELVAPLINQEDSLLAGLRRVQESIDGSCSVLLLTEDGIIATRDRLGRTPVTIGRKEGAWAVTIET